MQHKYSRLDISISDSQVNQLLADRINSAPIVPELVLPTTINSPQSYNRFRDSEQKDAFRKRLIAVLSTSFTNQFGKDKSQELIQKLQQILTELDHNGAVIFGNMINIEAFGDLINKYTEKLTTDGSKSWIHSYINFGKHPDFLSNTTFRNAFFHPLLIFAISYAVGGPVRLVDARGKDAEPLAVQAQDNMLHIDNTPFRKEFKVIVTWKKDEAKGPIGQNFVFIPGTHKGVRNCKVNTAGKAWSCEDGSIFITPEAVAKVFNLQKEALNIPPTVVEVSHKTKPLTTLFEAGALVHHRYRTKEKNIPRSCIIVAFHRAQDNPGQFLSTEHLDSCTERDSLLHLMMGSHHDNTEDRFLQIIGKEAAVISQKLLELSGNSGTELLAYNQRILSEDELKIWQKTVTSSPTVEDIKKESNHFQLGALLTPQLLTKMMAFDKHGPIDLILYGDGHEEIRKWARNRIREMPPSKLAAKAERLLQETHLLQREPEKKLMLTNQELTGIVLLLLEIIASLPKSRIETLNLDSSEKISKLDAVRSMKQLITDLGEAVVRCASRQAFLSTSLFLCLASDELVNLLGENSYGIEPLRAQLLAHYITTYVLIEKQIQNQHELALRQSSIQTLIKSQFFGSTTQENYPEQHSDFEYSNRSI